MHAMTMAVLVGVGTIFNSASIMFLTKALKHASDRIAELEKELAKEKQQMDLCKKSFDEFKNGFRKVREALIKKEILTQDFRYLNEEEPLLEFLDDFLKS